MSRHGDRRRAETKDQKNSSEHRPTKEGQGHAWVTTQHTPDGRASLGRRRRQGQTRFAYEQIPTIPWSPTRQAGHLY